MPTSHCATGAHLNTLTSQLPTRDSHHIIWMNLQVLETRSDCRDLSVRIAILSSHYSVRSSLLPLSSIGQQSLSSQPWIKWPTYVHLECDLGGKSTLMPSVIVPPEVVVGNTPLHLWGAFGGLFRHGSCSCRAQFQ